MFNTQEQFAQMFADDLKTSGITHETIRDVWHGMNYERGTLLVASPALDEYFAEKPYGKSEGSRWFWTHDGHRLQVRLSEVKEVAR